MDAVGGGEAFEVSTNTLYDPNKTVAQAWHWKSAGKRTEYTALKSQDTHGGERYVDSASFLLGY